MANPDHLKMLQKGVDEWNAWRTKDVLGFTPDLSEANLSGANLSGANLRSARLSGANLSEANLSGAHLSEAKLSGANLSGADLREANLGGANLNEANLNEAYLRGATLIGAHLNGADLRGATLSGAHLDTATLIGATLDGATLDWATLTRANLSGAYLGAANLGGANLSGAYLGAANLVGATLSGAYLDGATLIGAHLDGANLSEANLFRADLSGTTSSRANLSGTDLSYASLADADITNADLTGCRIYGVSAWGLKLNDETKQQNLIISRSRDDSEITVDNIEVAQFIYLMLNNQKVREVIDTITSKVVLILGRFTDERKAVLDALRDELRKRNYLPILFDFDKPASRNADETITLLARMARFVVADISDAKSVLQELRAIVPELPSVPVQPVIIASQDEPGMFDFYRGFRSFLPVHRYDTPAQLLAELSDRVIKPSEAKVLELRAVSSAR
jgi:uncharacterized protein YjbI with pentapeptide repeats